MILPNVTIAKNIWFVTIGSLIMGLEFEILYGCNGCHDSMMLCLNRSDIAIITVKDVDYRCIVHPIRKYEATHLLENSVLHNRGNI